MMEGGGGGGSGGENNELGRANGLFNAIQRLSLTPHISSGFNNAVHEKWHIITEGNPSDSETKQSKRKQSGGNKIIKNKRNPGQQSSAGVEN